MLIFHEPQKCSMMNTAFFLLLAVLFTNAEKLTLFSNATEARPKELTQLFNILFSNGLYIDKPVYYPTCKASTQNKFSLKHVQVSSRKKLTTTNLWRATCDFLVHRSDCLQYRLFPIKTFKCNWI